MPWEGGRTAVAEMRKHPEAGVDGSIQFPERSVSMAGRHHDIHVCEHARYLEMEVTFWSKCHYSREAARSCKQALHCLCIRRSDRVLWMSATVSIVCIEKWAFNVNSTYDALQ